MLFLLHDLFINADLLVGQGKRPKHTDSFAVFHGANKLKNNADLSKT